MLLTDIPFHLSAFGTNDGTASTACDSTLINGFYTSLGQ